MDSPNLWFRFVESGGASQFLNVEVVEKGVDNILHQNFGELRG